MNNILITGGTGFIGQSIISELMSSNGANTITSLSRDWVKIEAEKRRHNWVNFCCGDIRDTALLNRIIKDNKIDKIIHAAALKSITTASENPIECKSINVDGTISLLDAAQNNDVRKTVLISSDKAANPLTFYGQTKSMMEQIGMAYNRVCICRYGNVVGSTGSVLPYFISLIKNGQNVLPITNINMTRFWFSRHAATSFVLDVLQNMPEGIYIPKLKSATLRVFFLALHDIFNEISWKTVDLSRGYEKIHETMVSNNEEPNKVTDLVYSIGSGKKNTTEFDSEFAEKFTVNELKQQIETYLRTCN